MDITRIFAPQKTILPFNTHSFKFVWRQIFKKNRSLSLMYNLRTENYRIHKSPLHPTMKHFNNFRLFIAYNFGGFNTIFNLCLFLPLRYGYQNFVRIFESFIAPHTIFFHDTTAPSGPGPPHYRGFTIKLRHTTLGRTPLDE
jgi:hypothetical protein